MRQHEPNPDTGLAGDETDIQSYSYIIWRWIYDRLKADPYFVNFAVTKAVSALPVQLWSQTPFLGVYMLDENPRPPSGIFNEGPIAFSHVVKVGFQYILSNNDAELMMRDLDRVKWFIMRTILRDDDLTNRFDTKLAGGTAFNGISEVRIRPPRWGTNGGKNETPIGEQSIEMSFQFETTWYPYGFPDLERIDLTTGFPGPGSTPEERAAIPQAKLVMLFGPDSVPTPLPPDTPPPGPPPAP
jgi:hypothetical protein